MGARAGAGGGGGGGGGLGLEARELLALLAVLALGVPLAGLEDEDADEEVAHALRVEVGSTVVRLERLRSAQDRPIAKMVNLLPASWGDLDADDLAEHGLYELLRARGVQLHSATQSIGARTATAAEA